MNNSKIRNSAMFMVAAILVAGTISTIIPTTSFAQPYYEQEYYPEEPYSHDPYAKDDRKKSTDVNVQKIKCVNSNVNVNGIEITEIPQDPMMTAEAQALEDGAANTNTNGLWNDDNNENGINFDKNLLNICVNVNANEQVDVNNNGLTCEECFTQNLDLEDQTELLTELAMTDINATAINSFEELCEIISVAVTSEDEELLQTLSQILRSSFDIAGLSPEQFDIVLDCLNQVFNGVIPPPIQ